jgi:hypothetical protein
MSCHSIYHTPWTWSDAQDGCRACSDLGSTGVVDDLSAKTEADSLRLQNQQLFLAAVTFQCDFGLA